MIGRKSFSLTGRASGAAGEHDASKTSPSRTSGLFSNTSRGMFSPFDMAGKTPLYTGYLNKEGKTIIAKRWQQRFFALYETKLVRIEHIPHVSTSHCLGCCNERGVAMACPCMPYPAPEDDDTTLPYTFPC